MERDKAHWLQLVGQRLDPASYILARHKLTGSAVVVFKKGYLAQQAELGVQNEPVVWQSMEPTAAFSLPVAVAEMEFCTIEGVEYHASNPELGRGKRKRTAFRGPFLSLLLARRSALAGQNKLGLRLEHHVHVATPDFVIGRERFEASLSRPLLPKQRVKMLWRDAVHPGRSEWYTGMVVQEAEEWGPPAGAIWEGVSVMWDTDSSITHVSPWELTPLLPQQLPQQQQQQKVHEQLSGANLRNALQSMLGDRNASQRTQDRPDLLQMPTLHTRQESVGLGALPRVAEHPNHLPQLHLRGGAAQESGQKVAPSTTLAEPGSGVSADTPGALPWGQQPSQGQQQILGPGWALAQQHSLAKQQSLGDQQLASLQHFVEQQQQQLLGQPEFLGQQQSLGEQQLLSLQQLIEQQQQQPSLGLEQSAGWRQFLAQHQSVGLEPPLEPHPPDRGSEQQALKGSSQAGVKTQQQEALGAVSLNGVRAVPGVNGATVYAAFLADDKNVERTLEVFPTPQEAAKAHDMAAIRQHGLAAEPMLNQPLDSYSEVLSELRAYRRTNSTDDLDSPTSNPDSPGWVMNMRSQSLLALGIAPASPHTQRQLIASGRRPVPTNSFGAKQLPEPASRASSSRLAALVDQMPVPNEEDDPSAAEQQDVHVTKKGGKSRKDSGSQGQGMSISRIGWKHRPSRSPPNRSTTVAEKGNLSSQAEAPSASALSSSCQDTSSSSAVISDEEEQEELSSWGDEGDWAPLPGGIGDLRVGLRARPRRRIQKDAKDNGAQESNEEEWTGSPVARTSRSTKTKGGVRKSSVSTNPRILAARRATTGGRKRAEKLTNFSGVTLKNGRIAVMLWNPQTKKPIHLGYWPSSLAAGRIADKARLSADFRRNDVDLNFPEGDYSQEELPTSIAQLADFIREEQSGARAAEPMPKPASDASSSRRRGAALSKSAAMGRVRFSHYLGVSWNRQTQVWQARAQKPDGKGHCIGDYPEEQAAGRAYDEYALEHHGNGAVRNFPPSTYTGRASDNEEAYPCLKQYAADGDDWLFNHVPTSRHAKAIKTRPQSAAARSAAAAASSAATAVTTGAGSAPLRRLRSSAATVKSTESE